MKKAWAICNIVTGCVVAWTILAALLISVGCSPESMAPKNPSQTCPGIVARFKVVIVTDALTDIVLVTIPAYLCWQLQMSVSLKLQVLAVFSFRLPLVALAGLFLRTWTRSLSTNNPGVDRTPAIVFQQSQLCVSLMAGTIPCLKSFIRSFDTGSGVKAGYGSSNEYGSGHTGSNALGHGESYKLSSMSRGKAPVSQTRSRTDDEDGDVRVNLRPFTSGRSEPPTLTRETSSSTAYKRQQETDRDSQGSRQELFIRKDMAWDVSSDARGESEPPPGMLRLKH